MALYRCGTSIRKLTGDATESDVLVGKTFYNTDAKTKLTGSIPTKDAATITPTTKNQTIESGTYLAGTQTIEGSGYLTKDNIKTGVTIFGVTGTFTSDGTITDGSQMLKGEIAYSKGNQYTGTINSKAAATYTASTSDQTISSGVYLSGTQTIKAVSVPSASAILTGNSVSSNGTTLVSGSMTNNGTVTVTPTGGTGNETLDITDGYTTAVTVNRTAPYNAGYSAGKLSINSATYITSDWSYTATKNCILVLFAGAVRAGQSNPTPSISISCGGTKLFNDNGISGAHSGEYDVYGRFRTACAAYKCVSGNTISVSMAEQGSAGVRIYMIPLE